MKTLTEPNQTIIEPTNTGLIKGSAHARLNGLCHARGALPASFLALLLSAACAASADFTLAWDYPTNDLSTNLVFKLYGSMNVTTPLTNWAVLSHVPGTATTMRVSMAPAQKYFFVTASNFWGESDPSNVINTPNPVTNVTGIKISRP